MKSILKSLYITVLFLASALAVSCSKEEIQNTSVPAPEKDRKVFITVNGQLGEFGSDDQTRADLASVVRVSWTGSESVYVFEGTTCLGHVDAPATIADDRVAELSGTITAPSDNNAVLTFVYSNLFDGQPIVTGSKITVDLTTQSLEAGKIPFVIYGFANYKSTAVSNLVIPFKFATSAITASVSNLKPSTAITSATLSGVNTKCELTLGNGTVSVTGSTEGSVTRNAGLGNANTRGTAFIRMAVPVSSASSKSMQVLQGTTIYFDNDFASNAIGAGKSIYVVNLLSHGYEYVDLGLPSGLKWAAYNVGATKPEEYGDYFTWGETETYYEDGYAQEIPLVHWKSGYYIIAYYYNSSINNISIDVDNSRFGFDGSGLNYKWRESGSWRTDDLTMSKYVIKYDRISYNSGNYGPIDGKSVLEENDDVAQVKWGNGWRMPTEDEMRELITSCDTIWTLNYNGTGKKGLILKSKTNGNSMFLPAAGYRYINKLYNGDAESENYYVYYWSSSLSQNPLNALVIYGIPDSKTLGITGDLRWYGHTVRPVLDLSTTASN